MDLSGERRLPAARNVVWNALSDTATLAESLPPGVTIADLGDGSYDMTIPDGETAWRTRVMPDAGSSPAQSVLHLAAPADAERGFAGRADITLAEDGVFTRLLWRVAADMTDGERPQIEAAIDHVLTHIGQRAATPSPVAAQGAAGAAAAIVDALPSAASMERSPLQVIVRTLAAMPRDSTIGGALFMLVVLFVVGIL